MGRPTSGLGALTAVEAARPGRGEGAMAVAAVWEEGRGRRWRLGRGRVLSELHGAPTKPTSLAVAGWWAAAGARVTGEGEGASEEEEGRGQGSGER